MWVFLGRKIARLVVVLRRYGVVRMTGKVLSMALLDNFVSFSRRCCLLQTTRGRGMGAVLCYFYVFLPIGFLASLNMQIDLELVEFPAFAYVNML